MNRILGIGAIILATPLLCSACADFTTCTQRRNCSAGGDGGASGRASGGSAGAVNAGGTNGVAGGVEAGSGGLSQTGATGGGGGSADGGAGGAEAGGAGTGDEGGAAAGAGGATTQSWRADDRILAWYEADSLDDKSASGPYGPLVEQDGSVTVGEGLDGAPVFQCRKAAGGWLLSKAAFKLMPPIHMFVLAQAANVPALNAHDQVAGGDVGGITFESESTAAFVAYTVVPQAVPGGVGAWHLYDFYAHANESRVSVDGGPYVAAPTVVNPALNQFAICAAVSGQHRSDANVAFALAYEGEADLPFKEQLWAYLRGRFPSFALAGPPAAFDLGATGSWPTPPFDVIVVAGSVNNTTHASVGSLTPRPLTFLLGNDNQVTALKADYDDPTNQTDRVSEDGVDALPHYGNAIALANTYQAATGRPLLLIPTALAGSYVVPGANASLPTGLWDSSYPRGHILRNALFGSAVARTKDALTHGGTFRFLWWFEGEWEAYNPDPAVTDAWPEQTQRVWTDFATAIGAAEHVVYAQLPATPPAIYPNWGVLRDERQPSLQGTGRIMVSAPDGPFETTSGAILGPDACDQLGRDVAVVALAVGWR